MKRRDLLKDLSVHAQILKLKMTPYPSISNSEQKHVADSHEHRNETSNSMKCIFAKA